MLLVVGLDYASFATTGKSLLLGRVNKSSDVTTVQRTRPGPAVRFVTKKGSAPFSVTGTQKVTGLNADKVDGLDASDLAPTETVINPPGCTDLDDLGPTPNKIVDLGTFTQHKAARLTHVEFSTDLWVGSFDSGETGVVYFLRVDGAGASSGGAVVLKQTQIDLPAVVAGDFKNLANGHHTISLWAQAVHTGAHQVFYDQGCYGSYGVNTVRVTQFG